MRTDFEVSWKYKVVPSSRIELHCLTHRTWFICTREEAVSSGHYIAPTVCDVTTDDLRINTFQFIGMGECEYIYIYIYIYIHIRTHISIHSNHIIQSNWHIKCLVFPLSPLEVGYKSAGTNLDNRLWSNTQIGHSCIYLIICQRSEKNTLFVLFRS